MRKEVYDHIVSKKDVHRFIRENPVWYKLLSRNPGKIEQIDREALHYYKKTIPDQIGKIANGVQMANMMYNMFQAMNQNS